MGRLIGLGSARAARQASRVSALLSVVVGSVVMSILLITKNVSSHFVASAAGRLTLLQEFGKLFSDDMDVIALVSKVMPLVASFQARTEIL